MGGRKMEEQRKKKGGKENVSNIWGVVKWLVSPIRCPVVSRASSRPARFHPCGCIIVLNAGEAKDKGENIVFETEISCYSLSVTHFLNACGFSISPTPDFNQWR